MWRSLPPVRVLAVWALVALSVAVVGGLLFSWSGLYSVAASRGHWAVVSWFLELTMRSSVRTHSLLVTPPPLDDPQLIKLGAGHYAGGCAPCHGAPGRPRNPITRKMLPEPPSLSKAVATWDTRELFWIVKHGLKYTGMPSWTALEREDEVWAVVAFLRTLPGMTPQRYRALTRSNIGDVDLSASEILRAGVVSSALTACARCHGTADAAPTSRLVPKLAGQKQAYLERAMHDYAQGLRPSGIMQPVAAALDEDEIRVLAAHYASLAARTDKLAGGGLPAFLDQAHRTRIDLGRKIATHGIAREGIPPCLACHRNASSALFPNLAGQHATYLSTQLRLWKKGLRDQTAPGRIMAAIAAQLNDEQIAAVAAYFEALTPGQAPEGGSAREEHP